MNCLLLSLAALVLGCEEVFSASLSAKEVISEENIKTNLIGSESDFIEGLVPPAPDALNHYNLHSQRSQLENPYIVEISRNYLKIKVSDLPDHNIKLTREETEGIQKLSLSIVELLNSSKLASSQTPEKKIQAPEWNEVNPLIVLTSSGISLRFFNTTEKENQTTEITTEDKRILWDFLAKYAKNIFEAKLKELEINKFAEAVDSSFADQSDSSPFDNFVNMLWRLITFSVNYAEMNFGGWTTSPETMTREVEKKVRSTPSTLFAFEEPSPFHEFPSQEFQFRRKDIDSIFYGRGVI